MSGMEAAIAAVLLVVAAAAAALWMMREGFRQGDETEDPISEVTVGRASAGEVVVRAEFANPSAVAVVVTSSVRLVSRFGPLTGVGRVTRQRVGRRSEDLLTAVDGRDTVVRRWSAGSSDRSGRLVIDLYLWQRAGRIRRHRRVFLVTPSIEQVGSWPGVGALR